MKADFYAVWSVTGAHIGMWADPEIAAKVFQNEYPDGKLVPLFTRPAPMPTGDASGWRRILEKLTIAVGNRKVPKSLEDAALEVNVTLGPAYVEAREFLEKVPADSTVVFTRLEFDAIMAEGFPQVRPEDRGDHITLLLVQRSPI